MLRRLFWTCLLLGALPFALALGSAFLTRPCEAIAKPYDLGIVLGAGIDAQGRLAPSAVARVQAGIALYQTGQVRALHFTGGSYGSGTPSAGDAMAALALAAGLPEAAISRETRSHSTLQNALFSRAQVQPHARRVLVSEGFHLWRGSASFAWAGTPVQGLCYSTRLRPGSQSYMLAREGVAWGFNLWRAARFSVLSALGRDPSSASLS